MYTRGNFGRKAGDGLEFSKKRRILLVDDESDIVTMFTKGLERDGYDVVSYGDPQVALAQFKPEVYDLAILDIRMPVMNGFELCRRIRKLDQKIKIYFMTAFEINKEEFEKVLPSIKVDGFVLKPIRIAALCSTIEKVFQDCAA